MKFAKFENTDNFAYMTGLWMRLQVEWFFRRFNLTPKPVNAIHNRFFPRLIE